MLPYKILASIIHEKKKKKKKEKSHIKTVKLKFK